MPTSLPILPLTFKVKWFKQCILPGMKLMVNLSFGQCRELQLKVGASRLFYLGT